MKWWQLSSTKMTVGVRVDTNEIIVETIPVVQKFRGQHLDNLAAWMRRQPGFRMEELKCNSNSPQ